MSGTSQSDASLEEINNSLYRNGASDGLPVIPPTEERVEEMLRGTNLPRDEVIGTLGNRDDPITVERLATNAVMAGCKPIHLPVLVAGAKALADPFSNSIQMSVSTGSWSYFWLLNGPIRKDLDVQCDTGAFGPGHIANRTIGRALGLAYKNTTRIHPGVKDMATVGSPFKYSLIAGENEELNPWDPYHVTHGFEKDESTITLGGPQSFVCWSPYRNDAQHVLEGMVYHMNPYVIGGPLTSNAGQEQERVHTVFTALNPYNAEELDAAGMTKQEVKEYICENSHVPRYKYSRGGVTEPMFNTVDSGKAPRVQLPQVSDPEYIKILTIGGGGRFNATIGKSIGGPVTKKIQVPDEWDQLLAEYSLNPTWVRDDDYYD